MAQSLRTKELIADINKNTIPDAQARLTEANPKFSAVSIYVDTDSFGNNDAELGYVSNEIDNAYEAVRTLMDRSDIARAELEEKLKKITLRLVQDKAGRTVVFNNGELLIATDSFKDNYHFATDIGDALENGL